MYSLFQHADGHFERSPKYSKCWQWRRGDDSFVERHSKRFVNGPFQSKFDKHLCSEYFHMIIIQRAANIAIKVDTQREYTRDDRPDEVRNNFFKTWSRFFSPHVDV